MVFDTGDAGMDVSHDIPPSPITFDTTSDYAPHGRPGESFVDLETGPAVVISKPDLVVLSADPFVPPGDLPEDSKHGRDGADIKNQTGIDGLD